MPVMQPPEPEFAAQPRHAGLEALDECFCMLDSRWRVTYWNAAVERERGVPRDRTLGRAVWDVLPFLRGPAASAYLHRVRDERTPIRFVERYDGERRGYASVRAAPLPDGGITIEIRDAAEEMRRADRYSNLLESIRDGFVAVDEAWRIVYLNAVAEGLLRFPRNRAVGVSLWRLLPKPPEIGDCLRATMKDGVRRHLREVRPEGGVFEGRVFDLWTHALPGGGISIFFEDVGDRVQRERDLARLAQEANEANEAKSRFFAAISHEFRTPLNAIIGYTHLLVAQTYGAMPEPAGRAAERAGVCAEHLARLVDDVLLLTTAEIGRLPVTAAAIQLQDYLPAVVAPLQLQAQAKGLRFEVSVQEDLPIMETDPQRFRQLLISLLSNAVKFTSRGEVSVRATLLDRSRDPAADTEEPPHSARRQIEITVTDTGPGIAQEHRERIFGPFEQLSDPARSDSMARGSGLGLTVARQLAGLLRGKLVLAESSASGSRFCLQLPLTLHPESPSQEQTAR